MLPVAALCASDVGVLRESDDVNFLKPNGQSRNLNIYALKQLLMIKRAKLYLQIHSGPLLVVCLKVILKCTVVMPVL